MATKAIKKIGRVQEDANEVDAGPVIGRDDDGRVSLLDSLFEEMSQDRAKEDYILTVPARPNVKLVFDVNIDFDEMNTWVKRCTKGKKDNKEVDQKAFAIVLLANTNIGIIYNGEQVNINGKEVTVSSTAWHEFCKKASKGKMLTASTASAIKWMFGSDPAILWAVNQVMDAAGYNFDEITSNEEMLDPLDV